jgi:hypothetical protein
MVRGGSTKAEERHTGRLPNDQKAMVNAILELRKIVKTGVAEHITAGIEAFKVKAEGCLEPRELASEVADAETMLASPPTGAVTRVSFSEWLLTPRCVGGSSPGMWRH